jgi:protein-tyrosine phosphatase
MFGLKLEFFHLCCTMSLLKRLFKREPKLPPADYSVLGTDMHSHFIPGIDDGAKTMEDSLELIKGMQELGYKKVITTPHIMSDYYRNTPEIILGGLEKVRAALKENNIDMEIEAAAEYYTDYDLEEKIEKKELLTFGDNYVLFELPFISEPAILGSVTFNMQTAGYRPILAHVERYTFWHRDFNKCIDMKDKGVLLQLNINSLTGFYGPDVKKIGERLIDEDMIDIVGSDCHHMNHIQLMKECRTQKYLHKILEKPDLLNKSL